MSVLFITRKLARVLQRDLKSYQTFIENGDETVHIYLYFILSPIFSNYNLFHEDHGIHIIS
jgi:hypothetical protein